MFVLLHVVENVAGGEPVIRMSNVGNEAKCAHPAEEYVRQCNSGIIDNKNEFNMH